MNQEEYAPTNKSTKMIEEDTVIHDSIVKTTDNDTVDKSVCLPVVDLTDDAWLLVFSYVSNEDRARIARVCKRWRELAWISWKSVTNISFKNAFKPQYKYSSPYYRLTADQLKVILRQCGPRLRCLDLSYAPYYFSSRAMDLVGLYSTSLQELNLSKVYCQKGELQTLAQRLPRLTALSLQNSFIEVQDAEGELRLTLKMLQSLKSLNVGGNKRITGEFFSQAPQSLTEVFAKKCRKLTDRGVRYLSERCPNLKNIDISECDSLTGQSIKHLAKNCPKLKRALTNSKWTIGHVLPDFQILSNLRMLEELHMDYADVTDEVLYGLGRSCPLLRTISCKRCHKLTDAAIHHLSLCRHLESINLSFADITDEGLLHLSSAHPELKKVHLSFCWGISATGVGHLLSAHPNLLELDLEGCTQVTDRMLAIPAWRV